jgi:hypothetical protein
MRKKERVKNIIIEEYYDKSPKSNPNIDDDFTYKIKKALDKMDSIEDLDFSIDVNILEIISKGEQIRENRNIKLEVCGFIGICLLILVTSVALIVYINPKIFIYFQIIFSTLIPLILIPFSKNSGREA